MTEIITPLMIGLVGSFHCVGMCGPIAIGLPLKNNSWLTRISSVLLYNSGRILTYGILGLLFGILGKGIHLAGLQQWASIGIGTIMILTVVYPLIFKHKLNIESLFSGYAYRMIGKFRKMFANRSYSSLFTIGLLNGLLPCGLVYVAVAGALNAGSVMGGTLFMIIFGIGTSGLMMTVSLAGNIVSLGFRNKVKKVVPYFIVFLGLLFILRGMSLGIPYVSPNAEKLAPHEQIQGKSCCK